MKRLLILAMAAFMLTACVQYKDGKPVNEPEKKEETKPVAKEEKPATPQEQVTEALKKNKHAELIEISGQFFQEPYSVQVEYKGKENLSNKLTNAGMKSAVLEAVYAIKDLNLNISDVGISVKYPLTDKLGNTTDEYVIKSDFDKETIEKLNDDKYAVDVENLPDIAKSWWEHSAIK